MFFLPPEIGPILVFGSINQIGSTHNTNEAEKTLETETDVPGKHIHFREINQKNQQMQLKSSTLHFSCRRSVNNVKKV